MSHPLDRLFRVAIVFGVSVTVGLIVFAVHGHWSLPVVDLVLDTISFVTCAALTALAWARFRESRVTAAGYHASAFLVLAVGYAVALVISLDHGTSMERLASPEDIQGLVFTLARAAAAVLFVIAGTRTSRASYGRGPRAILVLPSLIVVALSLLGLWLGPPPDALFVLSPNDGHGLPATTAFGVVVHMALTGMFFLAAYASRRLWHESGALIDGFIAIGLIFAGFGELIWAMFPSAHPGQVSVGDLFRLAFSITLLVGLEAAVRRGLHDLRSANSRLADLRDAEVQRAALEERNRLARELHDGLAQDLWLAKLRTAEVLLIPGLGESGRASALAAASAVDAGLGEARQAVAALRAPVPGERSFPELVRRTVDESADRYGLRVEFSVEGDGRDVVPARTQAELLRILQEALTNVARHAEATLVGVSLAMRPGRLTLRIVDNGRGFDPRMVGSGSFGLLSIRERAALVHGSVRIASRPGDGARIQVMVPTGPAGTGGESVA